MTSKVQKVHLQSEKKHHSEIKMNSNSNILKLRSRIHKILDEQFKLLSQRLEKEKVLSKYSKEKDPSQIQAKINESRLQEWVQMFKNQILLIEEKQNYEIKGNAESKKQSKLNFNDQSYLQSQMKTISLPKPSENVINSTQSILWTIEDNNLRIYQRKQKNTQKSNRINNKQSQTEHFNQTLYQLPEKILKRNCSINYSKSLNSLIIIGGFKPSNPNIKSSKIYSLNLKSSSLQIIEKLPYGLSSHSAILHQKRSQIYVIGGNRNHSIVTRGCFRLDLLKKQVTEISCLNYPATSMNCVLWKQRWIYKFGGVGEAFGAWNTSPYIQRYSIQENQWEMINPSINSSLPANALPRMFLAKSNSYVCDTEDQIIVFGGYDIKGNFKNHSFVLKIQENHQSDENNDDQTGHLIKDFGKIENNYLHCSNFTFFVNSQSQVSMFGMKNNFEVQEIESNAPYLIHVFK